MTAAPHRPLPQASEAAQWYAIQTKYRCERRVTEQLTKKSVEIFLPLLREVHRWSDRRKSVNVPLFSGYTFARLDLSLAARMQVLRTDGVIGFVTFRGVAVPVPARQIEHLRALLRYNVPCTLHAFLKAGQRVRIRGGCLDGLEGILEQSGQKSLVIAIESIQRAVAIKIEGYEVELI
jgi:transcription antitermination factor NusG